jgi:hypothetical protein
MEDKLSALLSNPQLMQQIMAMAQSLGQSAPAPPPPPPKLEPASPLPSMPDIDPAMIGKIMSLAGSSSIDRNQKALLCALEPYLSRGRLEKLEKAMRAAKLAGTVSAILPSGAIPFLTGR